MKEQFVIGIDIGGTAIRIGAFNTNGKLLSHHAEPFYADRGPDYGINRIHELIKQTQQEINELELLGIGIGCTGPVDPNNGIIDNPHTLPTWEKVPIVAELSSIINVPIVLENDADAAGLGEFWQGAGVNIPKLYSITVGTGIGTSFIVDGEIYRGIDGSHPEGGHQIIDPSGPACYCGAQGCWESLASGNAIINAATEQIAEHTDSSINKAIRGDVEKIDAKLVARAARNGDSFASQIIEKAAYYFGLGLVNIITLFVPDLIILSGGVMKSYDLFKPHIQKAINQHNIMVPAAKVQIMPAKLGYFAGIYGAAYAILQRINE